MSTEEVIDMIVNYSKNLNNELSIGTIMQVIILISIPTFLTAKGLAKLFAKYIVSQFEKEINKKVK